MIEKETKKKKNRKKAKEDEKGQKEATACTIS